MENEQRACRKPRWYDCSFRSPIDPSTLRRLMRRSNLQGALQALGPSRPVRRYRHPHGLVLHAGCCGCRFRWRYGATAPSQRSCTSPVTISATAPCFARGG